MIIFRYILPAFVTCYLLVSCSKSLEKEPLQSVTEEYLWDKQDSSGTYAESFLNNIYSYLPGGFNRIDGALLDAASDDALPSENGNDIATMTSGGYSPFNNPDDAWGKNYSGIRRSNEFLKNFGIVPLKDPLTKRYWRAEARFLRSIFYYELIKRYGGVPLLLDRVLTLEDDINIPRNSFDECVQYIVNECQAIKDSLRSDPVDNGSWGHITKGVALTLKAKVLLLAASPLNNPQQDLQRWKSASDAARDVINLNVFALETSFLTVFTTARNKEVILAYQRAVTTDVENNNAPVGYQNGQTYSLGLTSPTQELIDAFGMKNGKAITDVSSTYSAADPYKAGTRDPRFYLTVFHNGMQWLKRPVETFEGGKDKPGGPLTQTRTGYYMRKFMANFDAATAYSNQTHNFIIFRYADLLLNFAEAQNEFAGSSLEVYKAVEDVRKRAGLVPFALPTGFSKVQMREAIRQERRVELAFEEQRFWDVRRWSIAETVYNKPLHGIKIIKSPAGTFSYQSIEVGTPLFTSKMYRYPIPNSEIEKNNKLQQNPGWE